MIQTAHMKFFWKKLANILDCFNQFHWFQVSFGYHEAIYSITVLFCVDEMIIKNKKLNKNERTQR